MKHENKRWQQLWGAVFIALAVVLYGISIYGYLKHRAKFEQLQQSLRQVSIDPAVVKSLAPVSPVLRVIDNPLALAALLVGIAWYWNRFKKVAMSAYGVLGFYLTILAALFCALLYIIWTRHLPIPFSKVWPVIAAALIYLSLAALLFWRVWKLANAGKAPAASGPAVHRPAVLDKRARTPANFAACNVLRTTNSTYHVWQFDARSPSFALSREQTGTPDQPLSANLVRKSWGSLWQKKLNVAWLPPEDVFIRVAQFPRSTPEEIHAMVELQLEKLSPIPVTQAVWSLHLLPTSTAATRKAAEPGAVAAAVPLQTVLVVIVARNVVEEFLGRLEGEGFLADRLEVPLLDQLQATEALEDGAWIYPETEGNVGVALVAWWYGGVLHNVDLLTLPPPARRADGLRDQLMQMAWAGELVGWLTAPPRWHLVGDDAAAAEWVTPLQEGLEQLIEVIPPLPRPELAARTARRSVQSDPAVNLLPEEFSTRYRQQFVDRLWIRGLLTLLGMYGVWLVIYFVGVGFLTYQTKGEESELQARGLEYTNAMQIQAQYRILKERQDLKYAALDCWEAVAETLPENVTLDSMNFGESRNYGGGKVLSLVGTAPSSEMNTVFDFSDKLRRFTIRGEPLFVAKADPPLTQIIPGGNIRWTYELDLKRTEGK